MFSKIIGFAEGWHSRMLGRLMSILGFVLTVGATVDWSPVIALFQAGGFSLRQAFWLALALFAIGALVEGARVYRADED